MYFYGINVLSIGKFIKFSSFQRYVFVRHFFLEKLQSVVLFVLFAYLSTTTTPSKTLNPLLM